MHEPFHPSLVHAQRIINQETNELDQSSKHFLRGYFHEQHPLYARYRRRSDVMYEDNEKIIDLA